MNYLERQTEIIEQLCNLMHLSAEHGYETASCTFDYSVSEDGSSSVGSRFNFEIKGKSVSSSLSYPEDDLLFEVIPKLHEVMKKYTGGEWSEFTIVLDKEGKAKTNFVYPK
ncbi:MAG: immunity protein YezG family protein [Pseudomonadota bacterium]